MEKEIFTLNVLYNGNKLEVEIKAFTPIGPDSGDYEVWVLGDHLFTLNPHLNLGEGRCWMVKQP